MDDEYTTTQDTIPDSDASEESDYLEALRPNKWQGASSTWTTLTADERGLAAGLDRIRNADLSLHLFYAHALKRRAREFEEDPEKVRHEYPGVPDEDQTYEPPKSWTAWPLPPHQVPREGEHIGPPDPNEKFTFKRREVFRPSREQEDVILGLTLKFAKERFLSRAEEEEEDAQPVEHTANAESDSQDEHNSGSQDSQDEDVVVIKEEPAPPSAEEPIIPGISIDDDRSRALLRPSIRHTLEKLDQVLIALHHARKSTSKCFEIATSDLSEGDDGEGTSPQKRPRGRPRKFSIPDRSRAQNTPSPQAVDDADLIRTKKNHLGRPLKLYDRIDGETQQDYIIRIAQIQKKPLPAFAQPLEITSESSPSRSTSRPRKFLEAKTTSEERDSKRRKKLHPRDWSEVLAAAALVGFPPDVIARTTQRCANLFGEGMTMRNIVETPFMEKIPDETMGYVPEEIPEFEEEILISSTDEGDSSNDSASEEQITDTRRNSRASSRSRIPPSLQTCFCTDPKCPRSVQGFKDKDALRRHLELAHNISKDDMEDYMIPSDEEMDGAVHVDGFLRPLKRLGRARGSYNKIVKKAKVEIVSDDGEDDEERAEYSGRSKAPATMTDNGYESSDDEEEERGEKEQEKKKNDVDLSATKAYQKL